MSKKPTKRDCIGCRDNFYNGNNELGVNTCWSLEGAEFVMVKFVPLDMRPPWDMPAQKAPRCYRKKGYVAVKPVIAS